MAELGDLSVRFRTAVWMSASFLLALSVALFLPGFEQFLLVPLSMLVFMGNLELKSLVPGAVGSKRALFAYLSLLFAAVAALSLLDCNRSDLFDLGLALLLPGFLLWLLFESSEDRTVFTRLSGVATVPVLVLQLGAFSFVELLQRPNGNVLILLLIVSVVATDIGAYFTGRAIGKRKLCPAISPKKTWEGSFGGTVAALFFSALLVFFFPLSFDQRFLFIVLISSVTGQMGDLVMSQLKRYAGVKDSGSIFPGHGGVLDRFDAMFAAAIPFNLLLLY